MGEYMGVVCYAVTHVGFSHFAVHKDQK